MRTSEGNCLESDSGGPRGTAPWPRKLAHVVHVQGGKQISQSSQPATTIRHVPLGPSGEPSEPKMAHNSVVRIAGHSIVPMAANAMV